MEETSNGLSPVELLAHEFVDRQQRGEKPTIREYCERYPKLADEIREVFEAVAMVEELKPNSNDVTGTVGARAVEMGSRPARVGDYRILREVGRGGMGVVYEAEQESLRRRVALKVMPRNVAGDEKSLLRFQREARAAARMHHTNIVPVFEVGEDEKHVFYAMQLIQGQALDLVIDELKRFRTEKVQIRERSGIAVEGQTDRHSRTEQCSLAQSLIAGQFQQEKLVADEEPDPQVLPAPAPAQPSHREYAETLDQHADSTQSAVLPGNSQLSSAESNRNAYFRSIAEIGLQTAQALGYAHARGIVHRDIKPSNLILDSAGTVWVTDFGLAKTSDESMTHTGDILGTIRYMSPERFRGQCDVRADIYALGLTLYELLVLRPAFASPDRLRLIEMVTSTDPPSPRSIDSRIPRDLETIVLKCADKDVRRRYQSADELCEDLERFIQDEPIKARRVSLVERGWRWSCHNKGLATSLGIIALLLLAINIVGPMLTWKVFALNTDLETKNLSLLETRDQLQDERNRAEDLATLAIKEADRAKQNAGLAIAEREAARRILYSADTNLAQHSLAKGNLGRTSMVLERHWPQPGQEDLRCWAWRHLWQRSQGDQIATLGPLDASAFCVALSPDKSLIAVADIAGRASLWDVASRQEVALLGESARASCVAFSPSGNYLAVPSRGLIEIWDWNLAKKTSVVDLGVRGRIRSLSFSADGSRLCCRSRGLMGNQVIVWDMNKNEALFAQMTSDRSDSYHHGAARISLDGKTVFSGEGRRLKAYDVESGQELFAVDGHQNTITALAVSPDKTLVATGAGYSETVVRVWNADDGEPVGQLEGHSDWIPWLEFMPDGKSIVSTSADQTTRIWDATTFEEKLVLRGHHSEVYGLAISKDGQTLATACKDGTINVWDAEPKRRMATYVKDRSWSRTGFRFAPDGQPLAVLQTGEVAVVDPVTLQEARVLPGISNARDIETMHGGKYLLIDRRKRIETTKTLFRQLNRGSLLYDYESESVVHTFDEPLNHATYLPSQNQVVVSIDSRIEYWDPSHWKLLRTIQLDETPSRVVLSPTGDRMASASGTRLKPTLKIWRLLESGECDSIEISPHQRYISEFAFSPDGRLLATSSQDGTARIIDVATGESIHHLRGHLRSIHSICFSPDGRRVATGGGDQDTVKIWDVATGQEVITLSADSQLIHSLAFSPDGDSIAATSNSGDFQHLWRAPSLEQIEQRKQEIETENRLADLPNATQDLITRLDHTEPPIYFAETRLLKQEAEKFSKRFDRLPEGMMHAQPRSRMILAAMGKPQFFEEFKKLHPGDPLISVCQAREAALTGDWSSAIDDYSVVNDLSSPALWYEYGAALLLNDRIDEFNQIVNGLANAAEAEDDTLAAYFFARTAALPQTPAKPAGPIVRAAERAANGEPTAWHQHVAALANYRAGDMDKALEWIIKSQESSWQPTLADLLKTLIYLEQGDSDTANVHWKRVQEWRQETEANIAAWADDERRGRLEVRIAVWLEAQILIREIEEKLATQGNSENKS